MNEYVEKFKEKVDEIVDKDFTHTFDIVGSILEVFGLIEHLDKADEECYESKELFNIIDIWNEDCQRILCQDVSVVDEKLEISKLIFHLVIKDLLDLSYQGIQDVNNPFCSAFIGFECFLCDLPSLNERAINNRLDIMSLSSDKPQACILIETIEREIASLVFGPKNIVEQSFSEHKNSIERITGLMKNLCDTISPLFENQDKLSKCMTGVGDVIKNHISELALCRIYNIGKDLRDKQVLFILSSLVNTIKYMKDYSTEYVNPAIDTMLEYSQSKLKQVIKTVQLRSMTHAERDLGIGIKKGVQEQPNSMQH